MAVEQNLHRVGKRKTAIARVYMKQRAADVGQIRINDKPLKEYFPRETAQRLILQPLELTDTVNQFDISVNVCGGGSSGQAAAVRHGISRTLLNVDPAHRGVLKKAGLLTRDAREVERKKYGQAGARRRFQFSKR